MSDAPLVSVIIPCYRQARYLAEAVDSALAQTYPAVEVVVINDGSDDDTEAVARRYGDRVRYVWRPNGGISAARNSAMQHARGAYFKFLDADDHLHPEQVAWQVEALAGRTDGLALTGVRFYRDGHPDEFEDHIPDGRDLVPFLLGDGDNWLPPTSYLVPAELARRAGGFDENLRVLEDWDFFSRIGLGNPPLCIDRRVGAFYRVRPGSLSSQREAVMRTRAALLTRLHDTLRDAGPAEWFGPGLLAAEQGIYQALVEWDEGSEELRQGLLERIRELQRRVGFGEYGWRFRLLARLLGYARAERLRGRLVRLLRVKPPPSLDTADWRYAGQPTGGPTP